MSHRKLLRIPYETKRSAGCAARRWEDRYAILLARLSPAALTGRSEGLGEPKFACGLCSVSCNFGERML